MLHNRFLSLLDAINDKRGQYLIEKQCTQCAHAHLCALIRLENILIKIMKLLKYILFNKLSSHNFTVVIE